MTRWKQIEFDRGLLAYVPCGFIHSHGSPYRGPHRIWRMIRFQLETCLPFRSSLSMRRMARHGSEEYRTADVDTKKIAIENGSIERLWWGMATVEGNMPSVFVKAEEIK